MSNGSEVIVLLHGSANGAYSWGSVQRSLQSSGATVVAPDMLGYGRAPAPGAAWNIEEETAHLQRSLAHLGDGRIHLVAHSLGAMFGLHLLRALGPRVTRLTLLDPVVVSVLRETGESDGFAEMEAQYQHFMGLLPDHRAAGRAFVEHWSGAGSWDSIGEKARSVITTLVSKVRLEMIAARSDTTPLSALVRPQLPTTILVGERTLIAPRATSWQLARAFHTQPVIAPGAGHMIPLTHPSTVVSAVEMPVAQSERGSPAGPTAARAAKD
jgi:pimeloyl-ACP methyl ester carboxylesterase